MIAFALKKSLFGSNLNNIENTTKLAFYYVTHLVSYGKHLFRRNGVNYVLYAL